MPIGEENILNFSLDTFELCDISICYVRHVYILFKRILKMIV